jgi:type IV secretion system protein VirB8
MNLKDLISKKAGGSAKHSKPNAQKENSWYVDRYTRLIVQRNILFVLLSVSLIAVLIATIVVGKITTEYTVEPFVIDIDKQSGVTNIVNPLAKKDLSYDEALNGYFVMKYIKARETYSTTDYKYNYLTVARLLSSRSVYLAFSRFVNYDPESPILKYGTTVSTNLKLRSIQFFRDKEDGNIRAVVRFTIVIEDSRGNKSNKYKIATVSFNYVQMEMNMEQRNVNPLGFQVVGYRVDKESGIKD